MAIVNDKPNNLAVDALAVSDLPIRFLSSDLDQDGLYEQLQPARRAAGCSEIDQSDRMIEQAANINQAKIAAGRMHSSKDNSVRFPGSIVHSTKFWPSTQLTSLIRRQ